jgi:hypothetical protein
MTADGICFYDRQHGFWSGSFVDSTHDGAVQMCLQAARQLAAPQSLPADGDIVAVNFVVNQDATRRILGDSSALESRIPTFEEWLKKK